MKLTSLLLLGLACLIFLGAASMAKAWALSGGTSRVVVTLALYTLGNLLMLVLIRDLGMATAFSLSAVLQLLAVNAMAIVAFGERVSLLQGVGLGLAVVAVALITLGPSLEA